MDFRFTIATGVQDLIRGLECEREAGGTRKDVVFGRCAVGSVGLEAAWAGWPSGQARLIRKNYQSFRLSMGNTSGSSLAPGHCWPAHRKAVQVKRTLDVRAFLKP
jgi:hypothetical protein